MSARLCRRALLTVVMVAAAMVAFARPAHAAGGGGYFVDRINAVRASRGLAPLAVDGQLTAVAESWSQHMAASGTLQHNPNLSSQVSGWRTLGENVGTGPSLESIEGAFENSPHHFENMVDPSYNYVGVGVTQDSNGTYWVTEDFKQSTNAPKPAPSPAPKPPAPAAPKPAPKPVAKPAPKPASAPRPVPVQAAAKPAPKAAPPVPVATTAAPAPTVPLAVLGNATERSAPAAASLPMRNPFTPANVLGLMATVVLGASMALFARVRVRRTRTAFAG